MNVDVLRQLGTQIAASDQTAGIRALEYDLPSSPWQWALWVAVLVLVLVWVVVVYRRDVSDLPLWCKIGLPALRLAVLAAVLVIAFNPQERTQRLSDRASRVAILVDRSLSMRYPATTSANSGDRADNANSGGVSSRIEPHSRSEAIKAVLADSPLVSQLLRDHDVSLFSFDSRLAGPHHVFRTGGQGMQSSRQAAPEAESAAEGEPVADETTVEATESPASPSNSSDGTPRSDLPDWDELVRPRGLETRLGESLLDLIRQVSGRNLSGIVVVTDGGSNAGVEPETANAVARAQKVRLIAVGVGSTERPVNLQLVKLQAPTDVHVGDPYEIAAFVQGQGLAQQTATVELLVKPEGVDVEPTLVETRDALLLEDGVPVEIKFERHPADAGTLEFLVRARTKTAVRELSDDDNERRKTINVVDRKTRVLLMAGGPVRDYRFVRNLLYRHAAVELTVWLQSADSNAAISQECDQRLSAFPATRGELFEYDVLVAFDPDWQRIPPEGLEHLRDWISSQAGGLIVIAGDIYTPRLAGAGSLDIVRELYPVLLDSHLIDLQFNRKSAQAWPIQFTREGSEAGFLQLADDPTAAAQGWQQFAGVYRCYPTGGAKAGAAVFAHFSDPRSQTEHGAPILMASQFYGSGRVLYLGTAELWRLRSVDEEYYDRFWTKAVRQIGQGRMNRGASRGMLLLERQQYVLGQTVRVRAQLLDSQYRPYHADSVPLGIFDPQGKARVPLMKLLPDGNRPGQFVGNFRVSLPGTYRLEIPVPESQDRDVRKIDVLLSNLESTDPRQNAQLLRELVRDTGGAYLTLEEAVGQLPQRLPNRGETYLVDERLRTLWDRQWVMYLLVGLLSLEWLMRKLLKLA